MLVDDSPCGDWRQKKIDKVDLDRCEYLCQRNIDSKEYTSVDDVYLILFWHAGKSEACT